MKVLLIALTLLISACSSSRSDSPNSPTNVVDFIGTRNYLKSITVSGNVLQTENRFLSYTKNANRISIIDPDQAIETWSQSASGFEYAVALPDFAGATLFAIDKIVVMTGVDSREFPLQLPYANAAAAKTQAAYSVSRIDGRSFEVVRSLDNGQWQQQVFAVPWGNIDPTLSAPPDDQPILLLSQFNHDGTMLAVFSPVDGRYAIYSATSISEPIMYTGTWCTGDGIGTPQNASFYSLVWDENRQLFFAGDSSGRIYAIDPSAVCPTPDTIRSLLMPNNNPIIHIAILDTGELALMQRTETVDTELGIVSFENDSFAYDGKTFSINCDRPLSSMSTKDATIPPVRRIIVMCAQKIGEQNVRDSPNKLLFSDAEPFQYITYDYTGGELINTLTIERGRSSGVAINRSSNTLYRMIEGAFGTLQALDLLNGQSTNTVGLYIYDLLE